MEGGVELRLTSSAFVARDLRHVYLLGNISGSVPSLFPDQLTHEPNKAALTLNVTPIGAECEVQSNRPGLRNLEFRGVKWELDRGRLVLGYQKTTPSWA